MRDALAISPTHNGKELESGIARSYGTCMTMGTAATMMSIAEGFRSVFPALQLSRHRIQSQARRCLARAVELVLEDMTLDKNISQASVENPVIVAMASGCSTNAIIHLIAIARRAGLHLGLDDFDRLSKEIPVLANIRPTGYTYLM